MMKRVTATMLGEAIRTIEELAVVKRTSPVSYAKWQSYVAKAVAKQPHLRTEAEKAAIELARLDLP